MPALRYSLLLAIAVLTGASLGFIVGTADSDDASDVTREPGFDPAELAAAEARALRAEDELERTLEDLERLRERWESARATPSSPKGDAAAAALETGRFEPRSGAGRWISSPDEAVPAFERALAAGDLEAMWLIGADLLALGEDAYPTLDALVERFFEAGSSSFGLYRNEQMWIGRFLRTFAEEHEAFLAYGLHLTELDPATLGPGRAELREEMFEDDLLPVLLAFHGGENPALTNRWLDRIEEQRRIGDARSIDERALLQGLTHIPDDRAVDAITAFEGFGSIDLEDIVQALVVHGSPRAIAEVRRRFPEVDDERLRSALERYLEN